MAKKLDPQTRQYHAELAALKKQRRSLAAQKKTISQNTVRALGRIDRDVQKAHQLITRNGKRAINEVVRGLKCEDKRLNKTEADIATRISILQGRIGK